MNDVPSFGDMRGSFIRRILFRAQKFKGDAEETLIIRRAREENILESPIAFSVLQAIT